MSKHQRTADSVEMLGEYTGPRPPGACQSKEEVNLTIFHTLPASTDQTQEAAKSEGNTGKEKRGGYR